MPIVNPRLPNFTRDNLPSPVSLFAGRGSKGTISLNIKLIQAPKEFVDYVLTHELCHFKQLNHGAEFYELLFKIMPNWQEKKEKLDSLILAKKEIKIMGNQLHNIASALQETLESSLRTSGNVHNHPVAPNRSYCT